jgi:hypothetical protein
MISFSIQEFPDENKVKDQGSSLDHEIQQAFKKVVEGGSGIV